MDNIPPGTVIGRYCSSASNIFVFNGNHPLTNKSMHPFFYNPVVGYVKQDMILRTKLTIGSDVWIGLGAIITRSVSSIGDGAVIGAGGVVTENASPFAVAAGNTAKVINYRFNQETINRIIESHWWNKSNEGLKADGPEFVNFLKPPE